MLYVDISYAKQIGYRLDRFKIKNDQNFLANFKCPICGDSDKKASKTRGYFYVKHDKLIMHCHNCQASMSFGNFLKQFDVNLYKQYALDNFGKKEVKEEPSLKVDVTKYRQLSTNDDVLEQLTTISDLDAGHPARQYVADRQIPDKFWDDLYYAPKFMHWASHHTDKFHVAKGTKDHPRLIIPWRSSNHITTGYSARSFGRPDPKYYTIPLEEDKGFCGLDRCDLTKRIYVLEGAIDSFFLPNSIAVGTSALWKFESDGLDVVYIPDRDIRNKEIMKIVWKMIEDNKQVCMLPDGLPGKDLNDFVINGLSSDEISAIIDTHTYQGLEARLQFTLWSRV